MTHMDTETQTQRYTPSPPLCLAPSLSLSLHLCLCLCLSLHLSLSPSPPSLSLRLPLSVSLHLCLSLPLPPQPILTAPTSENGLTCRASGSLHCDSSAAVSGMALIVVRINAPLQLALRCDSESESARGWRAGAAGRMLRSPRTFTGLSGRGALV